MQTSSRSITRIGACLAVFTLTASAWAQFAADDAARQAAEQNVRVAARQDNGLAQFVTGRNNATIPVAASGTRAAPRPDDFLNQYGVLFGVRDPDRELVQTRAQLDDQLHLHTTYEQVHEGVPVFSGTLKVHQNAQGDFVAANGDFYPLPEKLDVNPTLSADEALTALPLTDLDQWFAERTELVIVDPGWYGDMQRGAHLAYHVIVSDPTSHLREAFFIDAHTGEVLDRWSLWLHARNRAVYNGNGGSSLPGTLARSEGQGPVLSPTDVNRAYDYAGDVYDYFFRAFGRDSIDDAGMTMVLTVNSTNPPCPNAGWNGAQMIFCSGTVTDDITAHEIGHGVTQTTANLIYQNQPGQLNEAYSDIWGEMIDLYNGNAAWPGTPGGAWPAHPTGPGMDTPNNARSACSLPSGYSDGVRWLMGEDADAFGGAIRDMWDPTCFGDPDRNYSPNQTCPAGDNGGVHSGSGVANHAFAIMVDGKNFNGQNVVAIGPVKAGAVWYRALTVYLTTASDYKDAYVALNQAAADLIGTTPNDPITGLPTATVFTAGDAQQVDAAMIATEMHTDGACGATVDILDPVPPVICDPRSAVFADDFESGVNGWTTSTVGSPDTTYQWVLDSSLPFGRSGTGWFCNDLPSPCANEEESAVHQLTSPVINIPPGTAEPTMMFTHYVATEAGYDGGNLKIRVNGGVWSLLPAAAFTYNPYNTTLTGGDNTNPIAGEPAWSGAGGQWGTSVVDLTGIVAGGDTLQVRFEMGKDYCNGVDGWYLDDFEIFVCTCAIDADCDDGLFCTGVESCVGGICQSTGNPCLEGQCSEYHDACLTPVFEDDFESGNANGWSFRAAGSTASTGDWLIGDPIGTVDSGTSEQSQPNGPYAGGACAFTAQNPGGAAGTDDVDSGVVYLESPTIDLSAVDIAQLSYVRWHYCRNEGDPDDYFIAQVSNNNGATWTTLETLDYTQSPNEWTPRAFGLDSFVALTSTMKIRFGASDGPSGGTLVESAIDNFVIAGNLGCSGDAECDDGNACNGAETCVAGECVDGTPLFCSDGVACTLDDCDPQSGCVFTPDDGQCPDDGVFCNGAEYCDALAGCVSSGDPCGAGEWCHENTAACVLNGDGDLDADGDVDLHDYMLFQACVDAPIDTACFAANMDGGVTIDLGDFAVFVGALSSSGPAGD